MRLIAINAGTCSARVFCTAVGSASGVSVGSGLGSGVGSGAGAEMGGVIGVGVAELPDPQAKSKLVKQSKKTLRINVRVSIVAAIKLYKVNTIGRIIMAFTIHKEALTFKRSKY